MDSDYGNVVRLERKLQDLNTKDSETALAQAVPGMGEVGLKIMKRFKCIDKKLFKRGRGIKGIFTI